MDDAASLDVLRLFLEEDTGSMIKILVRAAIAGMVCARMVSGIVAMVNTAATILSALILLTAFVEVLPLLLVATASDESARSAAAPSSVAV